jgi:hypothetical protein
MTKNQTLVSLVDCVADIMKSDTSIARRFIVEGCVKFNSNTVSDPAFRLPDGEQYKIRIASFNFAKRLLEQ